jgi:hypothetical protein
VLEARGAGRRGRDRDRERDDGAEPDTIPVTDRRDSAVAGTAAAATVAMTEPLPDKRPGGDGPAFSGGADGGGASSDGGTSSGSSGSDGGGGGSGQ